MKGFQPYLIFNGNCREAMEFYSKTVGVEVHMMRFADGPGKVPEGAGDRIMHASMAKGSTTLMASDNMPGMPFQQGDNVFVSLSCDSREETEKIFAAFTENGQVKMPLQDTFWGAYFGMAQDRFGTNWMLSFEKPRA
jgi:PhnB protein